MVEERTSSSRRTFLKTVGAGGTVALAGCASLRGSNSTTKIGALLSLSGSLALYGQENERGYEFARQQFDDEILGEEFELIVEDTQTDPSTALQRARKLVNEDRVDALIGVTNSAAGLNVDQFLRNEADVPFIASQVATPVARESSENCNDQVFYPWPSFRQMNLANVEFITNELENAVEGDLDTSRAHFVGSDYEAGQSARDMFEDLYPGEMTGTTMTPQGTTDFSSYFSEIENADADLITGFMPGQSAVQMVSQAEDYGLQEEKTMCFLGDTTSPLLLGQMGAAANGWFGTHWYDETRDTDLNNQFKSWYSSNYDLPPNEAAANGYNQLYSLATAMNEAGSTEPGDVISELEGMSYESPMGELTYRASDHQTELNFIGYEVQDTSRNVVANYPDVIGEAYCQF